jgi:hypothetical protein
MIFLTLLFRKNATQPFVHSDSVLKQHADKKSKFLKQHNFRNPTVEQYHELLSKGK